MQTPTLGAPAAVLEPAPLRPAAQQNSRHRLANISNLPASSPPRVGAPMSCSNKDAAGVVACKAPEPWVIPAAPVCAGGHPTAAAAAAATEEPVLLQGQGAALATTNAAGRRRQQSAQVSFHPSLASPHSGQARRASAAAMSLQRQQQLAATPSAAGLVRRPAHAALAPAGADGASDDEAGGFGLHMSQS